MTVPLAFLPIDLATHSSLCVQFREDAVFCSFGTLDGFRDSDAFGPKRYLQVLAETILVSPLTCVHVWLDGAIIGQIEGSPLERRPEIGYVNLYYLVPEFRGKGLAEKLDRYAALTFAQMGCNQMQLSVSVTNPRALRFYERCGWNLVGPRENEPQLLLLSKALSP